MIRSFVLCFLLFVAGAHADDFTDFFSQTEFTGHFMRESPSARMIEIAAKLKKGAQEHHDWLMDYIKTHAKPGEALPYDPNLGVTQAEYEEFLAEGSHVALKELAQFPIKIVRLAGGEMKFDTSGKVLLLEKFSFYPEKEKIVTADGVMEKPEVADQSKEGGGIGPWKGVTFRLETGKKDVAGADSANIMFSFGRRLSDNMLFFHYRSSIFHNGQPPKGDHEIDFGTHWLRRWRRR